MAIRGFDSIEEMLATMEEDERKAIASIKPRQQRDLGWGTFGLRMVPSRQGEIPVWTEIYTEDEAAKGEEPETMDDLRASYGRGFRYGMHYSVLCPEGELGSAHISTMWPITELDFHRAKEIGWTPQEDTRHWWEDLANRIERELLDDEAGVTNSKFDVDPNEGQTFFVEDEGDTR